MPRSWVLSAAERERLGALPEHQDALIRHDTFSESDLSIIRQRRKAATQLGFAVQLCDMRSPGRMLEIEEPPFSPVLSFVAAQLKLPLDIWAEYGQRAETRRAHLAELQSVFGLRPFTVRGHKSSVQALAPLAQQTDKGIMLAKALIEALRSR